MFNVSTLSATTSSAQALFQLIPLFSLLLITMSTAFSTAPLPTGYPSDLSHVVAYPGVVAHISHQLPQTVGRVSVGQLHQLESLFGSASTSSHECVADRAHLLARYGRSDRPPCVRCATGPGYAGRMESVPYRAYPSRSIPYHRLFGRMVYALSARLSVYQSRPLRRSDRRIVVRSESVCALRPSVPDPG